MDDTDQPYAIYLPRAMDLARKYPLVVSLHGAGSNHRLDLRRVFGRGNLPGQTDGEASRAFPPLPDVPYIVVSPLARGTMGYQGLAEREVYDVVADVKRRFPVDEDRMYLTGVSMGGGGSLWMALTKPDVWAAVAALCPAPPPGTEGLETNALHMPMRLYHGELDPLTPVQSTRAWHKRLADAGAAVEYIEYPSLRHNVWDAAYRNAAIFEWFGQHKRNPYPERVRFSTRQYQYQSAWWVRLDAITPGMLAMIDARFTAENRIAVETKSIEGFTLQLRGHPRYRENRPVEVLVDGKILKSKGAEIQWKATRSPAPVRAKRAGFEGPLMAAFAGRHVFVYGTHDSPGASELERRRGVAMSAAESFAEKQFVTPRVLADRDLDEVDAYGSRLILFGTRETNRLIHVYSDRLPIHLNPGAADYGLVYIMEVNGRMMMINSGLPWWTGNQGAARSTYKWLSKMHQLLPGLPDFVLFRGSLDNVLAEGHFDNEWRLPAEADAKMRESSAVSLH